eukprot:scaffold21264_cov42-Attheya_sp.AAC.2
MSTGISLTAATTTSNRATTEQRKGARLEVQPVNGVEEAHQTKPKVKGDIFITLDDEDSETKGKNNPGQEGDIQSEQQNPDATKKPTKKPRPKPTPWNRLILLQVAIFCVMNTCVKGYVRGLHMEHLREIIKENYFNEDLDFRPCIGFETMENITQGKGRTAFLGTEHAVRLKKDLIPLHNLSSCEPFKMRYNTWEADIDIDGGPKLLITNFRLGQ